MICRTCHCKLTRLVCRASPEFTTRISNILSRSTANSKNVSSRSIRTLTIAEKPPKSPKSVENLTEMAFSEFDELLPKIVHIESPSAPIRSASFADYMNFSNTLQALVKVGVELHKIETKHPKAKEYLVALDLKKDIKPRLKFLIDQGVFREEIPQMITKNPKILDPDIGIREIKEVFDYLSEKKFTKDELLLLIVRQPTIVTMPVPDLDGILGFYQTLETNRSDRKIKFSNAELKTIILRCPKLVVCNLYEVYEQVRTLEVSCEFTLNQIRKLIIGFPHILIKNERQLELLYKFYFREMGITNDELTDFPLAFGTRIQIVLERHYYLKHLGRAQYKRDQPGYIALSDVYVGSDEAFCETLGLGDVSNFKRFIKTL